MSGNARVLVVLLGLLVAGGAFNYHRNLKLEQQAGAFRPYKGISDEELQVLISAYESELETLRDRVAEVGEPGSGSAGGSPSDLGERVRGFERVQLANERWKEKRREVMEREVTLKSIEEEIQFRRAHGRDGWERFLRRLTTF